MYHTYQCYIFVAKPNQKDCWAKVEDIKSG